MTFLSDKSKATCPVFSNFCVERSVILFTPELVATCEKRELHSTADVALMGKFEGKQGRGRKRHTYISSLGSTTALESSIEVFRMCNTREE